MKAHFARYSQAYFVGALFFVWQFLIAFKAQAAGLTPAIRSSMSLFDWAVFQANVALACLPTIIAFLNQSVATAAALPASNFIPPEPDRNPIGVGPILIRPSGLIGPFSPPADPSGGKPSDLPPAAHPPGS